MLHPHLYQKLKAQARSCRDRSVRQKLSLIFLAWKLENVTEACERRGYSPKFYYKWLKRLKRANWQLSGLQERSRRPRKSPQQICPALEARIRWYHRRQFGARMIEPMLKREDKKVGKTTICHVINGRKKGRRKSRKPLNPHRRRYELPIPGLRIQLDVKYVPELIANRRGYCYVAVDECTRLRFCYTYDHLNEHATWDFLCRMQLAFPFPIHTIQTDNGFEFTFYLQQLGAHTVREHAMEIWCREQGIHHRLIPPGAKELNGKVERSHRIDEQYFYWKAPTDDFESFNRKQQAWITQYNEQRVHGGIGYITPREKLVERLKALHEPWEQNWKQSKELCTRMHLEPEQIRTIRIKFLEQTPRRLAEQKRQQPCHRREHNLMALLERELLKLKLAA